ncbi:hypothetical protein [Deinococcus multiflagellatus]
MPGEVVRGAVSADLAAQDQLAQGLLGLVKRHGARHQQQLGEGSALTLRVIQQPQQLMAQGASADGRKRLGVMPDPTGLQVIRGLVSL